MALTSEPAERRSALDALDALGLAGSGASALVTLEGARSWASLATHVARLARHLDALGLEPGARVAFEGAPSLDSLVLLLALWSRGLVAVPLHARLRPAEADELVRRAGATRVDSVPNERELPPAAPLEARRVSPTDPAAIVFTSGTTGRPKGAVLSRGALVASARASHQNLPMSAADRSLACLSLSHVGGLGLVVRALVSGSALVPLARFDVDEAREATTRLEVTRLSLVPTMLFDLLRGAPSAPGPDALARASSILVGGAAASEALLDEGLARGWPLLTTYGLSEMGSQVATQAPRQRRAAEPGVGSPLAGVELRIDEPDADGVGRIVVRGPMRMDGYLLDADRPLERPFVDGYFDTGDFGRVDERGVLHVVGRRSDLVLTGGENVYPAEVEAALERHPQVEACAVFGVPHERWGALVAAAIVPRRDLGAPSLASLAAHAASLLAPWKRPRAVVLLASPSELPRTPALKLDRARLRELEPRLVPLPQPPSDGAR